MTSIAPEVIESLSGWEELADAARLVASDLDTGRFTLGDIACRVQTVYGADSIGKLAGEIGIAQKKTLWDYARVARRFQFSARNDYLDAGLTFSHFRTALRAGDNAELWLARAAEESWPVAELGRQISAAIGAPVPPRKLYDGLADVIRLAIDEMGLIFCTPLTDDDAPFDQRQRVRVVVYAIDKGGAA